MLMGRLKERAALPAPVEPLRPPPPAVRGALPWCPPVAIPEVEPAAAQPITPTLVGEIEDSIDMRLKQFADRLSQALDAIREADLDSDDELPTPEETGVRTVALESTTV
jgi:hypothetical protein